MIRRRTIGIPLIAAGLVAGAYFAPEQSDAPRPPSGVKVTQTTYGCPAGAGLTVAAGQVSPGKDGTATVVPDRKSVV